MTSIALTNANNCQNQGKGCSAPTPTRLVDILQRAFEEKVKNQEQLSVDPKRKKKEVKKVRREGGATRQEKE